MADELRLREATAADIPVLVKHRRWMFDDMRQVQTVESTLADLDAMEPAYEQYLGGRLGNTIRAWVIEDQAAGRVIASGALHLYAWPPRAGDITGQAALLHSVYTEPAYRRRGLARQITQTLIDACRAMGLRTVSLHASQAGRPLYESLGFNQTSEMRLILR